MALQHPLSPPVPAAQPQVLHSILTPPNRGQVAITVTLQADNDPAKYGFDLLFPTIALTEFTGFPVCEARVQTEKAKSGYASLYGWTQLVKDSTTGGKWEFDAVPMAKELNWPFCWFGPEPTLFDGPARVNKSGLDWTARSFFTYVPDTLLSKEIVPVYGFEWGFVIEDGVIGLKELVELPLAEWNGHVEYYAQTFPNWSFAAVPSSSS